MQKWWPLLSASASFSRSDTGCTIHNFKFSKNKKQACINDNIEARKTFLQILNMYWWQLPMEHPVVVTTWYYSTMLLSRAKLITACRTFCFWFNCSSIIPIWNESFSLRSSVWLMEKKHVAISESQIAIGSTVEAAEVILELQIHLCSESKFLTICQLMLISNLDCM